MKKALALLLTVIMVFSLCAVTATAATPRWSNVASIGNGLKVLGAGSIRVSGFTNAYQKCEEASIDAVLEVKVGSSWEEYDSWYETSPSYDPTFADFSATLSVPAGTYRLLTIHGATYDGATEYVTKTGASYIVK